VVPGHYTINVAAAGFKSFVQKNVLVEVGGDITVDAAIAVGNASDTVTVEASRVC
jgi:hypothetical protein